VADNQRRILIAANLEERIQNGCAGLHGYVEVLEMGLEFVLPAT
jgi:uncharacterized protein YeeX (DUF496 family)